MRIIVRENTLLDAAARFSQMASRLEEACQSMRQSFESLDAQSDAIAALRTHVYEAISRGERLAGGSDEFAAFMQKTVYEFSDADRFAADSVTRTANDFADLTKRVAAFAAIPVPSHFQPVGIKDRVLLESTGSLSWLNNLIRS